MHVQERERERERDGPVDQDKHLGAESLVASALQDRQAHLNLRRCQIGPNDCILYTQHKCPHPNPEADGFLLGDCLKDQETYFAGLCLVQSALRLNPLILNVKYLQEKKEAAVVFMICSTPSLRWRIFPPLGVMP
ncbi:hypothetical protein E2320_005556 [Naja naja]|nr:hypothetical protein E2320_005556 [Naja naja]